MSEAGLEEVGKEETAQGAPAGVRAFDQDGREVIVPREQWVNEVLPNMVKEAWDSPEQLYLVIVNSLNAGFFTEMADAAKHLYEIDTVKARGTCLWGIVLLQLGRVDEAEAVLAGFEGEDASVLVNLAKVYQTKGDNELAEQTLRRSLELDPNLDVAVAWFASAAQQKGGDPAAKEALELLRSMPGSWRAQLWLARAELDAKNAGLAKSLYSEALERAPRPVPPDFMMQMSGDLGGHGHLRELVELTAPEFVPEVHGLPVGNNLMKAHFDLGELDQVEVLRLSLSGFNRPDWRDALAFWDSEVKKRRSGAAPDQAQQIQIGMLRVDGPVWLPKGSRAAGLFGAKPADAPTVTFLGGTAEAPEGVGLEVAEALGRMTRSLPLYLAEQAEMRTAVAGRAMLPWAVGAQGGFVVSGQSWPDQTAVQAVSTPENRSDYVVSVHVDAEVEPWTAMLAFMRVADGARIGEIDVEFASGTPEAELPRLAGEVVELLSAFGGGEAPAAYTVPEGAAFGDYLVRLEQLLAVRCATMEGIPAQFLQNERGILEGEFALCGAAPASVPARLLLLETLGAMERVRPEVAGEFRERFMELAREKPLPELDVVFTG